MNRDLPLYKKLKETAQNREELQAPQTPYLFNIIEPGILGKIYETFLAESLIVENRHIGLVRMKLFRKQIRC